MTNATNTTRPTSPAANASGETAATTSRARRAIGLCASVCVLVTANAAFASPTTTNERDLVSSTPTLTQGDLPTTTSTCTVRSASRELLD